MVRKTRLGAAVLAGALALQVTFVPPARADEAGNLLTVAKTTLFGGLIGLVLGGVTALVVDSDNRDDAVRWGIVIGSFGGFGYGIWAISQQSGDDFFGAGPQPNGPIDRGLLLARAGVGGAVTQSPSTIGGGSAVQLRLQNVSGLPSPQMAQDEPAGDPVDLASRIRP
jgi:hypothetical protein